MSRMGGAGALAPLVADLPPEVLRVLRQLISECIASSLAYYRVGNIL